MPRLYLFLSLFMIACLLAGCAASASTQSKEGKAVDGSSGSIDILKESNRLLSTKSEVLPHEPPTTCPVTQAPEIAFVPPDPYPSKPPERYANQFWYGTPELWTMLETDATWKSLPHNRYGYTEKVFWWSQSFDRDIDPYPAFTVILERLDVTSSAIVVAEEATNASADFGTAMLTGIDIPTPGCWKITGQYQTSELSFVIWVAP